MWVAFGTGFGDDVHTRQIYVFLQVKAMLLNLLLLVVKYLELLVLCGGY